MVGTGVLGVLPEGRWTHRDGPRQTAWEAGHPEVLLATAQVGNQALQDTLTGGPSFLNRPHAFQAEAGLPCSNSPLAS